MISALEAAATRGGAFRLDSCADPHHNRLVLTLAAGRPEALVEALLTAVAVAVARIDLVQQRGVHPRVGAADVVPIVPLGPASFGDCLGMANQVGERIWQELGVPVYFYGRAARRTETQRLAAIRSGDLKPDLGGPVLHGTAGAVCVGVRRPMVAYNILLPGAPMAQAQGLARDIRESSGGLAGVQALAFELPGPVAQLSMNLVGLEAATPAAVLEQVRRLAEAAGLEVGAQEVVGLCPARAASSAADGRLLEARLAAAAARRGARICRRAGGEELEALAVKLERESGALAALDASQQSLLAGAERSAALVRVLRQAGQLKPDLAALLDVATRGFRRALLADTVATYSERVALLDAWLK